MEEQVEVLRGQPPGELDDERHRLGTEPRHHRFEPVTREPASSRAHELAQRRDVDDARVVPRLVVGEGAGPKVRRGLVWNRQVERLLVLARRLERRRQEHRGHALVVLVLFGQRRHLTLHLAVQRVEDRSRGVGGLAALLRRGLEHPEVMRKPLEVLVDDPHEPFRGRLPRDDGGDLAVVDAREHLHVRRVVVALGALGSEG